MEFEYDPEKSQSNRQKHGIDFVEAQKLWEDGDRIVFPARNDGEERLVLLARWNGKIWAAFYTNRGPRVRIISVRRARVTEERVYYES